MQGQQFCTTLIIDRLSGYSEQIEGRDLGFESGRETKDDRQRKKEKKGKKKKSEDVV